MCGSHTYADLIGREGDVTRSSWRSRVLRAYSRLAGPLLPLAVSDYDPHDGRPDAPVQCVDRGSIEDPRPRRPVVTSESRRRERSGADGTI